jgi:hypothetical protein
MNKKNDLTTLITSLRERLDSERRHGVRRGLGLSFDELETLLSFAETKHKDATNVRAELKTALDVRAELKTALDALNKYTKQFAEPFVEQHSGVKYSFSKTEDAIGSVYEFKGPGLPMHANGVHFIQLLNDWAAKCLNDKENDDEALKDYEAERVIGFLYAAFNAGKKAQQAIIREAIGAKGHDKTW